MKLLLDANISWKLAARLQPYFEACFHVDAVGLPVPAKDIDALNSTEEYGVLEIF